MDIDFHMHTKTNKDIHSGSHIKLEPKYFEVRVKPYSANKQDIIEIVITSNETNLWKLNDGMQHI